MTGTTGIAGAAPDGGAPLPASDGTEEPHRRARPIFLVVGLALAAVLAVGLFTGIGPKGSSNSRPHAGGPVPQFSVPRLGATGTVGVPMNGGGNGRPAIVLFFASWCGPCQAEIPAIAAAYRAQSEGGAVPKVALIGVDSNDPTKNALAFVHHAGVTFPVGVDSTFHVAEGLFYFTGLPEAVSVRADGSIAAVHLGALTSASFSAWERTLSPNGT